MKFAVLGLVASLVQLALQFESDGSQEGSLGMSTLAVFSNRSYVTRVDLVSNCSLVPWENITKSLSCVPHSDHSYISDQRDVTKELDVAEGVRIVRFKTDCWGSPGRDECSWVSYCWENGYASFPFHCKVYGNVGNLSNSTKIFRNWTAEGPLEAACTFSRVTLGGEARTVSDCKPLTNYSYRTTSRDLVARSVYNWATGESGVGFYTDCWGSTMNEQCYWVAVCLESGASNLTLQCKVYSKNSASNGSDTAANCSANTHSTPEDPSWCSNCTSCTFMNGTTRDRNVTCRPCRNFSYASNDYSVHLQIKQEAGPSSTDGLERIFTSDCGSFSKSCGWCASARRLEAGFEVSKCEQAAANTTRKLFRYELGYGIDWCANCTLNGSGFSGCAPCSSWAPYSQAKCHNNVTISTAAGAWWCANCTTCTCGFQYCVPCTTGRLPSYSPATGNRDDRRKPNQSKALRDELREAVRIVVKAVKASSPDLLDSVLSEMGEEERAALNLIKSAF